MPDQLNRPPGSTPAAPRPEPRGRTLAEQRDDELAAAVRAYWARRPAKP